MDAIHIIVKSWLPNVTIVIWVGKTKYLKWCWSTNTSHRWIDRTLSCLHCIFNDFSVSLFRRRPMFSKGFAAICRIVCAMSWMWRLHPWHTVSTGAMRVWLKINRDVMLKCVLFSRGSFYLYANGIMNTWWTFLFWYSNKESAHLKKHILLWPQLNLSFIPCFFFLGGGVGIRHSCN